MDEDDEELRGLLRAMQSADLDRRARDADGDRVTVWTGGPHASRVYLDELRHIGVTGWVQALEHAPGEPASVAVFVNATDVARLSALSPFLSAAGQAALRQDLDEHLAQCRRDRPGVDVWFEDVDPAEFYRLVRLVLTIEDAQRLRTWVLEEEPTWRAVATWAHTHFSDGWRLGWSLRGHQQVGMIISDVAAEILGERRDEAPWG